MAKREQMLRLKLIEEFIRRKKGASFQDIYEFLSEKFQEKDLELSFTERTFQRDKKLIGEISGKEIRYNNAGIFIFWKTRPKKIYSIPFCSWKPIGKQKGKQISCCSRKENPAGCIIFRIWCTA
ncbi:hypothetical protein ACH34E_02875 [Elizabethkingia anophelis]